MRRVFCLVALLAAACLSIETAAQGDDLLISDLAARRHGLTRSWFAQVDVDRNRSEVIHVTLNDGVLFAQTDRAMVHAIDAETGRTLWSQQMGRSSYPSLAPAANAEYVAVINNNQLYIARRDTGALVWEHRLGGSPGAGAALSPTRVFVPMVSGEIEGYKLELKKGGAVDTPWTYKSDGQALVQPMITPQTVSWTTAKGYMYVAGADTMGMLFRLKTHEPIVARPAYWTPYLYACSLDGYVYAVHERTGQTTWQFSTGDPLNEPPVAINNVVYVVTNAGQFFALSGDRGQELWQVSGIKQFVATTPSRVYVVNKLGQIVTLDAKTGARVDVVQTPPSMALINRQTDRIYLVSKNGVIQCLREVALDKPLLYDPPSVADVEAAEKAKAPPKAKAAAKEEATDEPMEEPATDEPATDDNGQ